MTSKAYLGNKEIKPSNIREKVNQNKVKGFF